MRVVVALGGNALLRRGQELSAENQRENAPRGVRALAPLAREHELVLSHGNGPQVGLLALQGSAYTAVDTYPLDVLGAQTEGMIGYMLEQELGNELPFERHLATLLTMIEVDATTRPSVSRRSRSARSTTRRRPRAWSARRAGRSWPTATACAAPCRRRRPKRIFGIHVIRTLLEQGVIVICAGGGGIPTAYTDEPAPAGRRLRRRGGGDRQGSRERAAGDRDRSRRAADRHRRRRGLRGLGHAATSGRSAARRPRSSAPRVRRGLDGAEGPRRVLVRRADRRLRRHRLDRTTHRRCCGARPARGSPSKTAVQHGLRGLRWRPPHRPRRPRTADLARALDRERARRAGRRAASAGLASEEAAERAASATGRTGSPRRRRSRAGTRSCASTGTRCRSCCWAAGVISIYPVKQPGTGIMILLLTLLNAVLGLSQEGKAAAAVAALAKMMIVKAKVRRDGALSAAARRGARARRRRGGRGRRRRARPTGACWRRRRWRWPRRR